METTSIVIGDTVVRTIGDSPSECFELRGWPCQYFEFTAPRSGTIVVQLTFVPDTQRGQVIDISIHGDGERWAQFYDQSSARLTSPVTAGVRYTVTLWYTFPRLVYTLRTAYSN